MNSTSPQVFISYAHESPEFRQSVKELAEYLRTKGIRVFTDHPYENRAPQEGWQVWMQHCVEDSDLVLVVCTPKYKASFEKREANQPSGFGRTWEAAIITVELYESKLQNAKYIPILPEDGDHAHVPAVLRAFSNGLRFPSQNERIFRAITEEIQDPNANIQVFQRRPPGQLSADDNRLVADQQDVYGREKEIEQVLEFLNGTENATQVVAQLTGTGGIGKTEICKRSLKLWLHQNPGSRVYWVGLNDGASPAECAVDIASALGHDNLPDTAQLFSLLRPGLYYLDNLESLDNDTGNALLRRIGQTVGVRVLASSRTRLAALGKPIEVDTLPLGAALRTFREAWAGSDELFDSPDYPVFIERDLGCHALSLVLVAALGDAKSLRQIIADWRIKGTSIARQEHDPTRRGSLAVSLHLSSDAVASKPGALLLWSVAALFPDGVDQGVLDWLYQSVPEISDESLSILARHRILKRKGDVYHLLPPVARFALDEAHREDGGFSWIATKSAVLPLLRELVSAADSIASTDEALSARTILLEKFTTVHRFLFEECRQAKPDSNLLAFFQSGLRNWFQLSHVLGKEILETIQPALAQSGENQRSNAASLQALGDLESRLGNVERARQLYDEAIGLFKKEQSDLGRANALQALGDLESRLGNVERARQLYDEAIGLFKKEQDDLGRANALQALGDLESRLGNVERARQLYDEAIGLFKKEQDDLGRANALQALGDLESRLGNVERARQLYDEAIGLFKKEQSDLGRANALQALGDLESRLGNVERARQLYDEAIGLFKKEQDDLGRANALKALGDLESRLGNVERARQLYDEAIGLFKKEQDDLGRANALKALGDLESRLGNVERARQLYDEAIGLFKKEQSDLGRANALKALGDLESRLGNVERARQLYDEAIGLFKKEQSDLGRANALKALGDLESRLGNVERARQLYDEAIGLFKKEQSDLGRANALQALGDLESRLGNVERARQLYDEAIGLFKKEQDDLGRANALQALGDLESRLGNVERARQLYDEAIGLFKKEQDDLGRANALQALGDLESRLGNVERARQLYDEAIGLFKKEQSDLGRANALKALGDLESRLGNVERARQLYDEAIGLFKKEQSDLGRANALKALGDLDGMQDNPISAEQQYQQALALYTKEQNPVGLINTYLSLAQLTHSNGPQGLEQASAQTWHKRSLDVARQTGVQYFIDFVEQAGKDIFK